MKKFTKLSLAAVTAMSLGACSNNGGSTSAASSSATEEASAIKFAVVYGAAHGNKCFSTAAVAVNAADGTIVDAFLDEYQFMAADSNEGVPNSDATDGFAAGYAEGVVLGSKKVNHEAYSAHMAEAAGATTDLKESYEAIEAFVDGKKAADLGDVTVDAVSGSTLADTAGYAALIAEAAEAAMASETTYEVADLDAVEIKEAEYAAHGNKCFTLTAAVVEGDKVVAAYIDDFQFMAAETSEGVPNSDVAEGLAAGYAADVVLGSKKANHEAYSAHMAEAAGATTDIADGYVAIEAYVAGKTVAELKDGAEVDAVSGSTLVDTSNYVVSVANAVENSK